jgi:hypothetical protein
VLDGARVFARCVIAALPLPLPLPPLPAGYRSPPALPWPPAGALISRAAER